MIFSAKERIRIELSDIAMEGICCGGSAVSFACELSDHGLSAWVFAMFVLFVGSAIHLVSDVMDLEKRQIQLIDGAEKCLRQKK